MKNRNTEIRFGKKDVLSEDEFDPRFVKQRISILLDQQVLRFFKEQAKTTGSKYQTLINAELRKIAVGETAGSLEDRLRRVEEKVSYLDRRKSRRDTSRVASPKARYKKSSGR